MAAGGDDVAMDFHRAFLAIDTDHSGEITIDELQNYCRKMNYQETFVQKWLTLFDADQNGRITYDEYCNALGLMPKQDVVAQQKAQQTKTSKPSDKPSGKPGRAVKVAKRRKDHRPPAAAKEEKTVIVAATTAEKEATVATTGETVVAPAISRQTAPAPTAPAGTKAAEPSVPTKPKQRQRRRNETLSATAGDGALLMRYSRARMFQRKALYRHAASQKSSRLGKKLARQLQRQAAGKPISQRVVIKPVGGDKNGGTRQVPIRRSARSLPTEPSPAGKHRRPKRCFASHRHRLRASIQPGCVLILLAGRHRGKRVVFLRQLSASGLLLVTGPLRLNGCPLRRVCQRHVIATSTRLPVDGLHLPDRVNDAYFRRSKRLSKKPSVGTEPDTFTRERLTYQLTQERREDQKVVDTQVLSAISSLGSPDRKLMLGYLRSLFSLKSGQRPHEMHF